MGYSNCSNLFSCCFNPCLMPMCFWSLNLCLPCGNGCLNWRCGCPQNLCGCQPPRCCPPPNRQPQNRCNWYGNQPYNSPNWYGGPNTFGENELNMVNEQSEPTENKKQNYEDDYYKYKYYENYDESYYNDLENQNKYDRPNGYCYDK